MKKTIRILLLFMILLNLISCEKNDFSPNKNSTKTNRVKQVLYEFDSTLIQTKLHNMTFDLDRKYNFIYEDENLISIIGYNKNEKGIWIENNKAVILYSGDTISEYYYEKPYSLESGPKEIFVDGNFVKYDESIWDWKYSQDETLKLKYNYQIIYKNNLIVEENITEYNWNIQIYNYIYEYSDTNIINIHYTYSSGKSLETINLVREKDIEIDYSNDKVSKIGEVSYEYDNNNLITLKDTVNKLDYFYSNGKVSKIDHYLLDIDNWIFMFSTTFAYNKNKDLTEENIGFFMKATENSRFWIGGYKIIYDYEEGIGNAKYLFHIDGSNIQKEIHNYPILKSCELNESNLLPYFKR